MIHRLESKQEVAQFTADLFLKVANEAVDKNGRFLVALSGGSTPALLFELLKDSPYAEGIPWEQTHIFWGDERLVPPTDDGSNYKQANELLLKHVDIPKTNIHRALGEASPSEAAEDYLNQLQKFTKEDENFPVFDLILLGMGNDGHTASLFPGEISDLERETAVISVTADYDGRPANRVTFTPLLINLAQHIVVLVTGRSKAETLKQVLEGDHNPERLPIQRIQPQNGILHWIFDHAAAENLKK